MSIRNAYLILKVASISVAYKIIFCFNSESRQITWNTKINFLWKKHTQKKKKHNNNS